MGVVLGVVLGVAVGASVSMLEDIAGEADSFAEAYVNHLPASKHRLEEYSQAQVEDPICSQVIGYCYQGV